MESKDKEHILIQFGNNLRKLRNEKKLSQAELYYLTNLGKNAIGRIERGEINPTVGVAYEIAEALGVEICELFPKAE